jgi:hypothetical protein
MTDDNAWWCKQPKDGEIKILTSNNGFAPLTDAARTSWDGTSLHPPADTTPAIIMRTQDQKVR